MLCYLNLLILNIEKLSTIEIMIWIMMMKIISFFVFVNTFFIKKKLLSLKYTLYWLYFRKVSSLYYK